jgi:hypothetical protein
MGNKRRRTRAIGRATPPGTVEDVLEEVEREQETIRGIGSAPFVRHAYGPNGESIGDDASRV